MRRRTGRSRQGFFLPNGSFWQQDDTVTITFDPRVLILNGLDPATESQVVAEEAQHEADFRRIVSRMERALRAAMRSGGSPVIDDYWAWYLYYLEEARATYHRQTGNPDVLPPLMPTAPRMF
ncbi:MAG: hypothetical protein ACE15B_04900 [Bryobacteraceae bacterium]